jgi:hypothetical protein
MRVVVLGGAGNFGARIVRERDLDGAIADFNEAVIEKRLRYHAH